MEINLFRPGTDVRSQSAAYLALAVIAEGCAEHIRTKYLSAFVQCICAGIKHPLPFVRNSALYAVGQFSEHLQPDINKYAGEILPVLFEYLSATCVNLANGQKVFLPTWMNLLFDAPSKFYDCFTLLLTGSTKYRPSLLRIGNVLRNNGGETHPFCTSSDGAVLCCPQPKLSDARKGIGAQCNWSDRYSAS